MGAAASRHESGRLHEGAPPPSPLALAMPRSMPNAHHAQPAAVPVVAAPRAAAAPCDGRFLVFIGGPRHSGTSLMHSLLIRKVYNTSEHPVFPGTPPYSGPKLPEAWPPLGASAAKGQDRTVRCATRWMIYKRPTNKIGDVETMTKRLPLAYPRIRLVWMRRDMASQVWSSLARFAPNVSSYSNATMWQKVKSFRRLWCDTNAQWDASTARANLPNGAGHALHWTVALSDLQARPDRIVEDILAARPVLSDRDSASARARRKQESGHTPGYEAPPVDGASSGGWSGGHDLHEQGQGQRTGVARPRLAASTEGGSVATGPSSARATQGAASAASPPARTDHSARRSWQMTQAVYQQTGRPAFETEAPPLARSALRQASRQGCTK